MSNGRRKDLDEILNVCIVLVDEGLGVDECLNRYPEHQTELRRILPVAMRLRKARSLAAPLALQGRIDARLLAIRDGERRLIPMFVTKIVALRSILRACNPYLQRRGSMIPALVTLMVVAIVSLGGLVAGADAAGPGDLLFGLDTAIEDVRLRVTRDDEREAELRIEFAAERQEELKIEVEGEGDPEDIQAALAAFQESLAELESLLGALTLEQRAELEGAIALLNATSQEIEEFEFEFEVEDGEGELRLELEFEGDEDGADQPQDDLDDDDLDDPELEAVDMDDEDEGDNLDDDLEDDECESLDNSGEGSRDGEDNSGEGSHDDDDDSAEASQDDACEVDDDEDEDDEDDDEDEDDEDGDDDDEDED